jgi:hypothetical protein
MDQKPEEEGAAPATENIIFHSWLIDSSKSLRLYSKQSKMHAWQLLKWVIPFIVSRISGGRWLHLLMAATSRIRLFKSSLWELAIHQSYHFCFKTSKTGHQHRNLCKILH